MTPSRKLNSKKQSAGYRRSGKFQNFKTKRCFIPIKKLKIEKLNMRKVSTTEQRRDFPSKKDPTEKRPEIRIIKAVSNASRQISRLESGKVKSNLNSINKKSEDMLFQGFNLKFLNKGKPVQMQNMKQSQKIIRKSPEIKNFKKVDTNINEKLIPKKQIERKVVEDTPIRSKRTPKPNRKYVNDNLITNFKSNKISQKAGGGVSDFDSESDRFSATSSDVDSDILRESEDTSTAEEEYDKPSKSKAKLNVTAGNKKTINISPTFKPKLSNDVEKNKLSQMEKFNQSIKNNPVVKQISLPGKTIILNKYSYNQPSNNQTFFQKNQLSKTTIDRSQKTKQPSLVGGSVGFARKRKLNEPTQQKEMTKISKINEKTFKKDSFDSDIDLNDDDDINNSDIDDFIKELTAQRQIKVVKKLAQVSKRSNSPGNRNANSVAKPMILNKSLQQPKEKNKVNNESKTESAQQIKQIKNVAKKDNDSESLTLGSVSDSDKEVLEKNSDPFAKTTASTLEDFEKMPTFTIVNINDIIGKKGDFMLEKMKNDPLKSEKVRNCPDSSDENVPSNRKKTGTKNRRKSNHTNLLSENFDKNKDPPPRTPFPPQRKSNNKKHQLNTTSTSNPSNIKILNNNLKLSKSVSSRRGNLTLSNKSQNKGPPRILNSMVAKKTTPITTFSTKVDTRHSNDMSDSDNEVTRKKPKENIKNQLLKQVNENKLENKNQSPVSNNKRKLPSEKVIIQRQGNKIIKKITCFETWYVINLPPETLEKENTIRNIVEIPLINLANQAKTIDLPNNKWTCKVSLQKCTGAMVSQNSEPYTGEIYDDYINPDEIHKYRPSNVMFRRQALHPTPKVPYDRAVIFKNNTFFTNIEGKNVKLLGAPHQIEKLKDIEILLNLIDDFSLKNQFVELAPYVP
ncbi:probable WRKY transcription factor protein 1 [Condylostylus longicornis]|uniref:probable WRKY transcription factor protein 1 n=1 Tax=Condylostylus longicornis TaxID=2530218 RepID=UPI00244DC290|nr:probable WRKY transcription factor protein 1 [Condylostylus longicornis]